MRAFDFARVPPLYFGAGKRRLLPTLIASLQGGTVLLVTGAESLEAAGVMHQLRKMIAEVGIEFLHVRCAGEPTATLIDDICTEYRDRGVDVVVGIGGGSVVDAGKAISAMLPHTNSILDHLEGVGRGISHNGIKKPYIAIPTTSGTGSEVTKNAVISEVGPAGYKKSLRHDALVPDIVIVDAELLITCPRTLTVTCGLDAFTQLLEPYLSPTASPLTEALAWSGFEALHTNFLAACGNGAEDVVVRASVAYASLLSGICLANDGLGILHGLASPIGGYFPIPHSVVCATLLAASVRSNLKALRTRDPESIGLYKMARVGELLDETTGRGRDYYCDSLVETLDRWTEELHVPMLSQYGIAEGDFDKILDGAANRNNPIILEHEEIRALLAERL